MIILRRKKFLIGILVIAIVAVIIIVIGGQFMNNKDRQNDDLDIQEINDTGSLCELEAEETNAQKINMIDGLLVITEEDAKYLVEPIPDLDGVEFTVIPRSYDLELAKEKGLATDTAFTREYLYMQALYRKALEYYLEKTLEISKFEHILVNHELNFVPCSEQHMDFYQRYSTFGFQFIYLRNNLPIERLSLEDLDILRRHIIAESFDITEELLELVERTFQSVIIAHYHRELDARVSYHSVPIIDVAPNNALVLMIRHSFIGNAREQSKFLEQEFIPTMEKTLSEKLGIPVAVFLWQ